MMGGLMERVQLTRKSNKPDLNYQTNTKSTVQTEAIKPDTHSAAGIAQLQKIIGNKAVTQLLASQAAQCKQAEDEQILQNKSENRTGMPDNLKSGIEGLSGYSLDNIHVHYNSDKPAQLDALAYTQGTDIHVSPGQESHLPHEAWHAVQQMQGRVRPTVQTQGVAVNDSADLENEADQMGQKAIQAFRNRTVQAKMKSPLQFRTAITQFGRRKGDKKSGTFIGDISGVHLHIDIGHPHLQIGMNRYDLRGPGGYGEARLREALDALNGNEAKPGYKACKKWLENQLG